MLVGGWGKIHQDSIYKDHKCMLCSSKKEVVVPLSGSKPSRTMSKYNYRSNTPGYVVDEIITKVETTRVVEHLQQAPALKGSAAGREETAKEYAIIRDQWQGKPEKKQGDEVTDFIQHVHASVNSEPGATFFPFRRFPVGSHTTGTGSRPASSTTDSAAAPAMNPYRRIGWSQPGSGGATTYDDQDRPTGGWKDGTATYDNPSTGWGKPSNRTSSGNAFAGWAKPTSGTVSDNPFTGWAKPTNDVPREDRSGGWPKTNGETTYGDRPGGWSKPAYADGSGEQAKPNTGTHGTKNSDHPAGGGWANPSYEDHIGRRTKPSSGTGYDDYTGGYAKPTSPTYGQASGGRTKPSNGSNYSYPYDDRPTGGWNGTAYGYDKPSGGWTKPSTGPNKPREEISTDGWSRPSANVVRPSPDYEKIEPGIVPTRGTSDGRGIRQGRWNWNSTSAPNPEGSITKPTDNIEALADYVKDTARPAAAGRFAQPSSPSVPVADTIDSKEAARRYNGVAVDRPPEASQTIDSQEAAKRYHGRLIPN